MANAQNPFEQQNMLLSFEYLHGLPDASSDICPSDSQRGVKSEMLGKST